MRHADKIYHSDKPTDVVTQASIERIVKDAVAFQKQQEYYKANRNDKEPRDEKASLLHKQRQMPNRRARSSWQM